jgi:hypothetical protein
MAIDFRKSYPIIQWDLNNCTLQKYYFGSKDDSANGFKLQILQDSEILVPSTEEVYFYFEKKDKTHGYLKATISEEYFIIDLTNQVYAAAGEVSCNFQITSNSEWKSSPEFIIKVDKNNIQDSIESSNDFKVFQEALDSLGDVTEAVNEAVINANSAVLNAETAITNAKNAASSANTAAANASEKAESAKSASDLANKKAELADLAASTANTAAASVNTSISNAQIATQQALDAAVNADEKASLADKSAASANIMKELISNETLKIYKPYVNTYEDIFTTYPAPENGWSVVTKDSGVEWRYNGTSWINIGLGVSIDIATESKTGIVKGGGDVLIKNDGTLDLPVNVIYSDNIDASVDPEMHTDSDLLGGQSRTYYEGLITNVSNRVSLVEDRYPNLSNPNLLINGDFQVWQKGTIFDPITSTYTADRWAFSAGTAGAGSVKKLPNGLRFIANHKDEFIFLQQFIEFGSRFLGEVLTASIKVNGVIQKVTGELSANVVSSSEANVYFAYNQEKDAIHLVTQVNNGFIDIEWVKLEVGSIATPFIPRLYAEELSLCKRYFNRITCSAPMMTGFITGSNNFYLIYNFPVTMRKVPTFSTDITKLNFGTANLASPITNLTIIEGDTYGLWMNGTTSINNLTPGYYCMVRRNDSGYVFMDLDAEIY